jgi:hypothetical protein
MAMKSKLLALLGVIIVVVLTWISVSAEDELSQTDIAKIHSATAQFHRPEAAQAAGYDLIPGLDNCFDKPGVGGMGFHYIDANALDIKLDLSHPEAMVYTPTPDGLQLGAVEYIVPEDKWLAAGNTGSPELNGMSLHLDPVLHVYVLHVWVWKNNPRGVFNDWNSNVSCP